MLIHRQSRALSQRTDPYHSRPFRAAVRLSRSGRKNGTPTTAPLLFRVPFFVDNRQPTLRVDLLAVSGILGPSPHAVHLELLHGRRRLAAAAGLEILARQILLRLRHFANRIRTRIRLVGDAELLTEDVEALGAELPDLATAPTGQQSVPVSRFCPEAFRSKASESSQSVDVDVAAAIGRRGVVDMDLQSHSCLANRLVDMSVVSGPEMWRNGKRH